MVTEQTINLFVEEMQTEIDKVFAKEAEYWWTQFKDPCPMMYSIYLANYKILRWNDFTRLN